MIYNFLFSAIIKWKASIDTIPSILGGKIPCLLVENKIDLLDKGNINNQDFESFSKINDFCGCFRTSAKTGFNISESMEFLIKYIINRKEKLEDKPKKEHKYLTNYENLESLNKFLKY